MTKHSGLAHPQLTFLIRELTSLRIESNLRREDIAKRMGLSASAIQHWEEQTSLPTANSLILWAEALGYEFDLHVKGSRYAKKVSRKG